MAAHAWPLLLMLIAVHASPGRAATRLDTQQPGFTLGQEQGSPRSADVASKESASQRNSTSPVLHTPGLTQASSASNVTVLNAITQEELLSSTNRPTTATSSSTVETPDWLSDQPMGLAADRSTDFGFNQAEMNVILSQFEKIDEDMQIVSTLLLGLESESELKFRLIPRDNPPPITTQKKRDTCHISKSKLSGLQWEIDEALSQVTGRETLHSNNCELKIITGTNNCNDFIKSIQCGVGHLRKLLVDANNKNSLEHSIKWKAAYDKLIKMRQTELDNMKQSLLQTHADEKGKLTDIITKLKNDNEVLSNNLENANPIRYEIKIISLHINGGKITDAVKEFKELKSGTNEYYDEVISAIITQVFSYVDPNNMQVIDNAIECIRNLPFIYQVILGSNHILKELSRAGLLSSHYVLTLSRKVHDLTIPPGNPELQQQYNDLLHNLKAPVTDAITLLANNIRNGNYEQIIRNAKESEPFSYTILEYLPDIIKKAYANSISNFKNVKEFVVHLPWNSHLCKGFQTLFDEMKENEHLHSPQLVTLYYTARLYERGNRNDLKSRGRPPQTCWDDDKITVPRGVKALIDDPYVIIESKIHLGFTLYGSAPGNIYTYEDNYFNGGSNQRWYVSPINNGEYFRFKNKENDNVLYADSEGHAYSDDINNADYRQHWEVVPIDDDYFYFKNRENGRILDANNLRISGGGVFAVRSTFRSVVHAWREYLGTDYHKWKIR